MDANEILKTKKIFAVTGVSQDESKYGFEVFNTLIEHKYKTYPINPKYNEIAGHKCFPSIDSLPEVPEVLIVVLAPHNTGKIIESLVKYKDTILWLPPGCWSVEVIEKLNQNELIYIFDVCPVGKLKGF